MHTPSPSLLFHSARSTHLWEPSSIPTSYGKPTLITLTLETGASILNAASVLLCGLGVRKRSVPPACTEELHDLEPVI